MKYAKIIKNCGLSVLLTAVFYSSYYVGLLFNNYTVIFAVSCGVFTSILLISSKFSEWAERLGLYVCAVLILAALFQNNDMHLIAAELLSVSDDNVRWGERQLICNCIWFCVVFLSGLISLAVTAVLVYIDSKKYVGE